MDQNLSNIFSQMNSDPDFISLNYQQQFNIRAAVAGKVAAQDVNFQLLSPDQQQSIISQSAFQSPSLQDKNLENIVNGIVSKAKQGDQQALENVNELANMNASARSSTIITAAAKIQASLFPGFAAAQFGSSPESLTGSSLKSLMDGNDAAKLSIYFGELPDRDPIFAQMKPTSTKILGFVDFPTGGTAIAASVGSLIDSIPFIMGPAGAAEKAGVGIAKGIAEKTASRFIATGSKIVIPALTSTIGAGIGQVAQQNALAAVSSNPDLYTNTANKIASTFGQGAAVNFMLALGFRAIPSAIVTGTRTAKKIFGGQVIDKTLASTGSLWWKKATDPSALDEAVRASGGTPGIPTENVLSLNPFVRDSTWIRNYATEAASRDMSTLDLRPLDQIAIASNDMPDVIFAPKDWSKPTDSGFNIWETKVDKVNKKLTFLNTGEADNLGDLRSKLSDMFSSRFDGINDASRPNSMVASQTLIIQGKLQALNAKAYDPFPEIVDKGFTRPSLRGYLSPTEAQDAAYASIANGGQAYHVKLDLTSDMVNRIADNKPFMIDGTPLKAMSVAPEEANALAIIAHPATPEALRASQVFVLKSIKENAGWTEAEARKFFLVQNGFDGYFDANTGMIETLFPSRMKWITDQFDKSTGKLLPKRAQDIANSGALGSKIALQAKIESSIGKESLIANPQVLANIATSKFKGTLDPVSVQNFVKQISDAKGIDNAGIQVRRIAGATDLLGKDTKLSSKIIKNADGSITVNIPERITSFTAQKKFVNDMMSGIDKIGIKNAPEGKFEAIRSRQLSKAIDVAPSRFVLPFENEAANLTWLQSIAKSEFGNASLVKNPHGGYALVDASNKVQGTFKDLFEARDSMFTASLDEKFIRGDLYKQGYKLTGKKGSTYTISGPGIKTSITGNSIQDLLKQIDYKPSKISNRFAPRDVEITPDKTIATFDGKSLIANPHDLANAMAKFENPDELANMVNVVHRNTGDAFKVSDNYFRVDVPNLGLTKYFGSIDEAKAFLDSDLGNIKNLKSIAFSKNLSLFYNNANGGFILSDGTNILNAASKDDVMKIFRSYPDAPGAREVFSALDPQADAQVKDVISKLDPNINKEWKSSDFGKNMHRWNTGMVDPDIPENIRRSLLADVGHAIRNFSSSHDRFTEGTINQELGLKQLGMHRGSVKRGWEAQHLQTSWDDKVIMNIFSDEHGRIMPIERREAIIAYKEAQGMPENLPRAKAIYGELSSHEQAQLARFNTYSDKLFERFSIDPDTYVKGFVSHVRQYVMNNWEESSIAVSADEILQKAYNGNVPPKISAYFRNERAEAIIDATMENDPIKIFHHYVDQGNKEMFLKQPMQDMLDYMRNNKDNIPRDVIGHVMWDLHSMAGYHEIEGMAQAEALLGAIHKNVLARIPIVNKFLKPTDAATGTNMFRDVMSVPYIGLIGFRAWPAVRNLIGVYQTLAPRIGIEPVANALAKVIGPKGKDILLRLRSEGTLLNSIPSTIELSSGTVSKIARKTSSWISSSDDLVRATAAITGENMLNDGIRNWNNNAFKGDIQKFKNFSGLKSIQVTDSALVDKIAELATSGDALKIQEAKQLFGKKLADETSPEFAQYAQPHMYSGNILGYLIGRMGTWSTLYRENIYRGWQNAQGIADKAAFATRFMSVGLGIAGGCALLGINGNDFIPGYGGLFGGGPHSQMAIDALQSPSTYAQGTAARKSLEKALLFTVYNEKSGQLELNYPSSLPGSLTAHYGKQFLDAMDQGDLWKMILAATSTPIRR
jgi:hypothetical protein